MTEIKIETDFIKLDALLKFANLVSSAGRPRSALRRVRYR